MNQSKSGNSVLKSQLICIHCAAEEGLEEKDGSYPQCANCSDKKFIIEKIFFYAIKFLW